MTKLAILVCALTFSYTDFHAATFEPVYSTDTLAKNIAGEVPEEVMRLITYLKDPRIRQRYKDFGVDLYKGFLFTGKPGTGKTALAKAIAGETQAPFFAVKLTDIITPSDGETEKNIHDIFEAARKAASKSTFKSAIIFIDEIDAIAHDRSANIHSVWRSGWLNVLLTEMDGFEKNEGIIVIGATNRPEMLDDAIMRPGRFDKIIEIPCPSPEKQKAILELYLDKVLYEHRTHKNKKNELIQKVITLLADRKIEVTAAVLKEGVFEAARCAAHDLSVHTIQDALIIQAFTKYAQASLPQGLV
ncbi:MAG: AAA family ATPase [Candidatus Babeliales bacterium]